MLWLGSESTARKDWHEMYAYTRCVISHRHEIYTYIYLHGVRHSTKLRWIIQRRRSFVNQTQQSVHIQTVFNLHWAVYMFHAICVFRPYGLDPSHLHVLPNHVHVCIVLFYFVSVDNTYKFSPADFLLYPHKLNEKAMFKKRQNRIPHSVLDTKTRKEHREWRQH